MRLDLLINDFVWKAVKERSIVVFEGHYTRTSVHVTDVARAFIHALDLESGQIYNVGAVTTTKIELCKAIQKQVKFAYSEGDIGWDSDQRNYRVSDAKFRATGFQPLVTLDQGIAELIKGYRTLTNNRYGNV
jgi:nucleoside-diphosphate-sugar epimerase